ncbi:hypothetical protein F5Y10DRAFT_138615 [Nemania abortiva]|nr:hypothetical protein F5Y10DRAFT_138615 [Nemania abortiva]
MASPRNSVASSQPDQRHLRIIAASAQANEARVRDILAEEPPWTTSSADLDALRQALQKVAARGKLSIVRLLIEHGADVNPKRDAEIPALVKAAESGNVAVVAELLAHNADPNARNRLGQTALFVAAIKGHDKVVEKLVDHRADINAQDKEGRSPLLYLASEKISEKAAEKTSEKTTEKKTDKKPEKTSEKKTKAKWTAATLRLLHQHGADLEVRDQIGRTPLLWAATNSNLELARFLLENGANVTAANNRGRTALHLSAESNDEKHRDDMVELLLRYGANPEATSDGGWTPLHNAAQSGHVSVVALLLKSKAKVNAVLSNGMTPLHWAAFNGYEAIVKLLLARPDVNTTIKDGFDRTPMLCAAEKHHNNIVQLLSPARIANRLSELEKSACEAFKATVVDFGKFEKKQLVSKYSVYDLLYGWDNELDKPLVSTLTNNLHYKPDFRWIHLPANNIAWVETLLAKSFIEAGHRDIESFKALEKCFDQEHRGPFAHAHFMRTFCHRIPSPRRDGPDKKEENPLTTLSEDPSELSVSQSQDGDSSISRSPSNLQDKFPPNNETKKKSKSEQIAERHPKKPKRAKGPPGNPQRQDSTTSTASGKPSISLPWDTPRHAASHGKIVLFMPFLHYETDERRRKMSNAIRWVLGEKQQVDPPTGDSLLIQAYLRSNPPLHVRRTLDQFFYHGIDTSARDVDQVVYRFCNRYGIEKKVFMVDQLWLWVLGKDLVITCFPQRWEQPKNDPLNVLDSIIEETNAKTRPPIQSVYDLAMLITSRCSGMFDHSRLDDQDYQFLDMFESSIGVVTDRESKLFSRFNRASAQSAEWLKRHRRRRASRSILIGSPGMEHENENEDEDNADQFPDALLDIGVETSLLAEIKDIRDELNIIMGILDAQLQTVTYLEGFVAEEVRGGGSRRTTDAVVSDIRRRAGEQKRGIDAKQKDVSRMDRQALSLYDSLTDLLDLKQKHSNALEARFAGDQAVIAAKQGQTIMVFTIVTIIFLPLSFIASFFAINFVEWTDQIHLTIPYVSKYLFGIGLAISVPLVALAFSVQNITNGVNNAFAQAKDGLGWVKKKRARHGEDDAQGTHANADLPIMKPSFTGEKAEFPKLSISSRREDYYRPPLSRAGEWDGNKAWMRPRVQSRERGDEYYGRGPSSPVSPMGHRKMSLGSGNANNVTWATRASFERGVTSGARSRALSQDLESGRFQ